MIQEDTISAVTTAPGNAAVGIIRISGPDSLKITNTIFFAAPEKNWKLILPIQWYMGSLKIKMEQI